MKIARAFKNERLLRSLTGLNNIEFKTLLVSFDELLYQDLISKKKNRIRKAGGGRKGALKTSAEKLFYILLYMKVYPTFDLASFFFEVDRSRTCRWTQRFLPLLEKALGRNCVLPKRQIRSVEEFIKFFPEVKDLFIDGTERRTQRPKSQKKQKKKYSGKKKTHTRKNTIATDENKKVLLVSKTKDGRIHDKKQLDKTGWSQYLPPGLTIWVDTGYNGIEKNVNDGVVIMKPKKKSKHHPLTAEDREENKIISGIRIVVENAIAGVKRYGVLSQVYRNRKGQDDRFMMIASGLWNLHLRLA